MKKRILTAFLCLLMIGTLILPALAAPAFTDVKPGDYFAAPVNWAVSKGITNGTSNTTFSPGQTCTRAQILTFLWRAAGSPGSGTRGTYYSDVAEDAYYAQATNWATEWGLLDIEGVYLKPDTPCSRGEAIQYIWAVAKRPNAAAVSFKDVAAGSPLSSAVSWAVHAGVTKGTSDTTFSPKEICTRGQIVTFLHRYFVGAQDVVIPQPQKPAVDQTKLDPLPPADYKQHAAWYISLTPVAEMSNAKLVAESDSLAAIIADYKARDAFITDSIYIRRDDIMYQIMDRRQTVDMYEQAVENNRKYGWEIDQSDIDAYEELVAKWGDPAPLYQ